MHFIQCGQLIVYISTVMASLDFHRPGWLDKMVQYHKNQLFNDFQKVPTVQIVATLEPEPKGYVDSPDWDFDSVSRLLLLVSESEKALDVRRVLQRMLGNTRRKMTFQESVKAFPSLGKVLTNEIYYDLYSAEMHGDVVTEVGFAGELDSGVIVVANPVEARIPSAMISINLLRKILEERAKAARYMPTTQKTIPWRTMSSNTQSVKKATSPANARNTAANTGATGASGAAGNGTTAGASNSTAD